MAFIAIVLVAMGCQRTPEPGKALNGPVVEVDVSKLTPGSRIQVAPGDWIKWTNSGGPHTARFREATDDLLGIRDGWTDHRRLSAGQTLRTRLTVGSLSH